ncbi:uncharacterized protein CBO05P1_200 [Clostridium botulinum B str. Osaka05]|uniref:Uncharacterized protein n=1 Tax=Clostridium botulinum B str. Osaka05 TaxID=1407017 RepID=A0A060N9K1_CLOBO|nr:hypothetical protein [Clostridium botulinum]BAO04919.1 uncharacterized protein CBO05P1_200 [Clostridium botulinum B str. Osaka05]
MNSFLKREIKDDLDLIEKHIEKIENELLGYPDPKQIIHLYETYERLINVYRNNHVSNNMNKNDLNFYIRRRNTLKEIKKKLRERMDYLFNDDKKIYKKLIYTYENMIRQYEVLYDVVRIIQVNIIQKLDVIEIDYIEIKDIELLKEIISYYNDKFKKSAVLKPNFTSNIEIINDGLDFTYNEYDNKTDVRLKLKGRFIFVKFNKNKEFNIVFKNEKVTSNGEKVLVGNKVMIKKHRINFKNDPM